ncbi:contact-dependent growth inhibition system immunity protein [Ureibacillus composti]
MGEKYVELENFLSAHFHQDIKSIEEELDEFVQSVTENRILLIINEMKRFLADDKAIEEKEEFIEDCCDLYFPELGLRPLEWLEKVVQILKQQ